MKVAISSTGPNLDDQVDPRLGRCEWMIFADPETLEFEAEKNESGMLSGGAGIQTAKRIADKGAEAVLTGNCGPNAFDTLSAAGLKLFTGVRGTVREALDAFRTGAISPTGQASVESHHGMGAGGAGAPPGSAGPAGGADTGGGGPWPGPGGGGMGRGMGGGMGMGRGMGGGGRGMGGGGCRRMGGSGRGMGGGMGRGMGGGWGAGEGMASGPTPAQRAPSGQGPAAQDRKGEIAALAQQAEQLQGQLEAVMKRIRELEESE